MKQMQYLPEKTYNSAVLSLLCILPLQYVIHKNMLNLFGRWITSEGSEKDIAVPQQNSVGSTSDVLKAQPRTKYFRLYIFLYVSDQSVYTGSEISSE